MKLKSSADYFKLIIGGFCLLFVLALGDFGYNIEMVFFYGGLALLLFGTSNHAFDQVISANSFHILLINIILRVFGLTLFSLFDFSSISFLFPSINILTAITYLLFILSLLRDSIIYFNKVNLINYVTLAKGLIAGIVLVDLYFILLNYGINFLSVPIMMSNIRFILDLLFIGYLVMIYRILYK